MKKLLLILPLITCCATYRNANDNGYSVVSGGFKDEKINDGIYRISVQSGVSPISNETGVRKIWLKHAGKLCSGEFEKYNLTTKVMDQGFSYVEPITFTEWKYYVSEASGYAICASFSGSFEQAQEIIERPAQILAEQLKIEQAKIISEIQGGCDESSMDSDTLEKIGVEFYKARLYQEAMICFLGVFEKDKEQKSKVDVYSRIGLMYELGQGVEKNMDKALYWYKLAGLL